MGSFLTEMRAGRKPINPSLPSAPQSATRNPVKIFLSYRTADMDGQAPFYVGKIFQRLSQNYGAGNIIMDMNIVPPGVRFDGFVKGMVGQADVVVVIIGPQWAQLMQHRAKEAKTLSGPRWKPRCCWICRWSRSWWMTP